jgi:hypothetical protein
MSEKQRRMVARKWFPDGTLVHISKVSYNLTRKLKALKLASI